MNPPPATEYKCGVCKNSTFRSRSDWLVHLVLATHSKRVMQNFQQWQGSKSGDLFVISGLDNVENSMLLEYLSANLATLSDIVFFKPRANVALVVGERREFDAFLKRDHQVGGVSVQIKLYHEMDPIEWKSYFGGVAELNSQGQIVNKPQTPSVQVKRKRDDEVASQQQTVKMVKPNQPPPPPSFTAPFVPPVAMPQPSSFSGSSGPPPAPVAVQTHKHSKVWKDEMDEIQSFIFMSSAQIESRRNVITHLTDMFKQSYPNCKMIPVGADILGYNTGHDVFMLFFDSKGITAVNDERGIRVNSESDPEIDRHRTNIIIKFKALQDQGIFSDVQCQGKNCVVFKHLLFDLKCHLLMRPLMLAQTARLCKHLYSMDERVAAVLNMVTYWTMQRNGFGDVGLCNPYVIYWLVYFFMMKVGILPSVAKLQKSCNFQITDRQNNVAFPFNESTQVIEIFKCNKEKAQEYVELLLQWFVFIDDTLGETNGKGINRRHSLICPRFVELIDKRIFKVCWEKLRNSKKKKHLTSKQKRTRQFWSQNLIDLGFEESMWENLLGLKLPDTLSIQHPLYISENISLSFDGPFSRRFFPAISQTRVKLARLIDGDPSMTSILQSLSNSL